MNIYLTHLVGWLPNRVLEALDFFKENLFALLCICYFKFNFWKAEKTSETFGLFLCWRHYRINPIKGEVKPLLSASLNID